MTVLNLRAEELQIKVARGGTVTTPRSRPRIKDLLLSVPGLTGDDAWSLSRRGWSLFGVVFGSLPDSDNNFQFVHALELADLRGPSR